MAILYKGGRAYYHESIRRNGKVTSRYRGAGTLAALLAALADERRGEREAKWAAARAERAAAEEDDRRFGRWFDAIGDIADLCLIGSGYYKRNRHRWVKRRGVMVIAIAGNGEASVKLTRHKLDALVKRAKAGDRDALRTVMDAAKDDPDGFLAAMGAPIDHLSETNLVHELVPGDGPEHRIHREHLYLQLERKRKELGRPGATPLEKLLIERIVLSWVRCHWLELCLSSQSEHDRRSPTVDLLDRRLSRAQSRLCKAIKTLAEVRKVPITAVQINLNGGAR